MSTRIFKTPILLFMQNQIFLKEIKMINLWNRTSPTNTNFAKIWNYALSCILINKVFSLKNVDANYGGGQFDFVLSFLLNKQKFLFVYCFIKQSIIHNIMCLFTSVQYLTMTLRQSMTKIQK